MGVLSRTGRSLALALSAPAVLLSMMGCAESPAARSGGPPRVAQAQWCERAARDPVEQARIGLDTMGLVRWDAGRWWLAEPRCPAPAEWIGRREPDDGPVAADGPGLPAPPALTVTPLGPARRIGGAMP